MIREVKRVLQICHGYDGPFLDCARQYASLFDGTDYRVVTVFLTGRADPAVASSCLSEQVFFLEMTSKHIKGLKISAIAQIKQIVRARNYSFCIAHRSKPTYIACLATDLPIYSVHHAFGDFDRLGRKLFVRFFQRRLELIAVSDAVREDIQQSLVNWPSGQLHTLYNRINVRAVRAAQETTGDARKSLELSQGAWVVGNVGRLHPDKDQATLLRGFALALPSLPKTSTLAILGKGRLEKELKKLATDLGISDKVRFFGQVPDARKYFRAFDVFALTSDHEPFGMVLLEAMAAGVSPICTDCGGGAEVVEGCGQLFTLGAEEELAECLIRVSKMNVEAKAFQQRAMNSRLEESFSDEAARQRFWMLASLKGLNL
ncbi:MAG TPA: glycosyltransferase [Pseudomonas xinjiangensis]|uniref:Glycosyltransferase n=2 Tax=root TaxID=1 RepID=A0A7V1FSK8_9GAMM|nr:glycosyltransferase [Halopseudomonas xinjiangensis]HEC49500.1 glycosyltransferase [Halopseudomonas xinjiangensis]